MSSPRLAMATTRLRTVRGARKLTKAAGTLHRRSFQMYRELDATRKEIRLLRLEPGLQHDQLHGSFEYTCLPSPDLQYETVSYAWGDALQQSTVFLSGHGLDIPRSAETVLQHLRYRDRPRLLWIDSVCINQRMQLGCQCQVALMHEVYGGGVHNVIWLGHASERTPAAIRSIEMLAQEFKEVTNDLKNVDDFANGEASTQPFKSTIDPLATRELYESPWFKRVWVLQEACLSSHSICLKGTFAINFIQVLRAACVLNRAVAFLSIKWMGSPQLPAVTIAGLVAGVFSPSRPPRTAGFLQTIITNMIWFECTDPRDRVYGVVGLYQNHSTTKGLPRNLKPNYSATVESVWLYATRQAIIDKNSLDILRYVPPFHDSTRLPSWVPDFSVERKSWLPFPQFFMADDNEALSLGDSSASPSVLTASGFVVDKVKHVKPTLWQTPGSHRNAAQILDRLAEIEDLVANDPQQVASVVYAMQLGTDNFNRSLNRESVAANYIRMKEYLTIHDSLPDVDSIDNYNERDINDLLTNFYMRGLARCVFQTKTGYLGLGVIHMRPGDIIAILFGSQSPVILRPLPDMDSSYSFVGLAFVDGIMDGSLVRQHRASSEPDVTFHLR
ncbi:hypothetical protein BST61_g8716 [Cercospora zeina]